ncbi:MAG TPA: sporulation protein YunB [Bacillales bacterium]|nr:sporulation protein YunB [Bacillales bacterium]
MFKPKKRRQLRIPRLFRKKPGQPLAPRHVFMISFIIFLALTVWGLWFINAGIKPTLMAFAKSKTQDVATTVINVAVNKQLKEMQDELEFQELVRDNNGEVSAVVLNTQNIAMVSTVMTNQVQNYLNRLEEGNLVNHINTEVQGIQIQSDTKGPLITTIPLGLATRNSLLANLGPQVPVRFQVIGNVESNPVEKRETIGINTIHLRIYLHISVSIRAIIPFATEAQTVTNNVPLVNVTFSADTPIYYGGNGNGDSPDVVLPSRREGENNPPIAP